VILGPWSGARFLAAARKHGCSLAFVTPRMLFDVVEAAAAGNAGWACDEATFVVAGFAAPARLFDRVRSVLPGARIRVALGMTEAPFPITWSDPLASGAKDAAVTPFAALGPLQEAYSESQVGPPGEVCELKVRGGAVCGGAFASGDLVTRDEHEVLHYHGRRLAPTRSDLAMESGGVRVEWVESVFFDLAREVRVRCIGFEGRHAVLRIHPFGPGAWDLRVREHFERHAVRHAVEGVALGVIETAHVPLSSTGKIMRT
jgi:hypothetical protein